MQQMTTIYLVRHGHIQLPDEQKYYLGRTNIALSEQGKAQAQWLRNYFAQKPVRAVYHSPLSRCAETAEILAANYAPCIAVPDLQEIFMGDWEMVPMEHIKTEQPELYQLRGEKIDTFCPPGGESFAACQQRSVKAFEKIALALQTDDSAADNSAVIIAHAGVNRCLLSWITSQPLNQLLAISQPYACVTKLIVEHNQWQIADYIACPV